MNLSLTVTKKLPATNAKKLLKKVLPSESDVASQCLVVMVDSEGQLLGNNEGEIRGYSSRIDALMTAANFKGKLAETAMDFALVADKKAPLPLLLVGVGDTDKLSATNLQKIATAIYQNTYKRNDSVITALNDGLSDSQLQQFCLALLNASYRFETYKTEKTTIKLTEVVLLSSTLQQSTLDYAAAVHSGQSLARDMANEPGNICYPVYLADQARALAKTYPDLLKVTVIGEKQMATLGMNCFLSVSKGSVREGQLVIMEYQGKSDFSGLATANASFEETVTKNLQAVADKLPTKADSKFSKLRKAKTESTTSEASSEAPIVLVGKGVTFDSGGISIKPGAAMDEMKFDMGGAASVIGTIKALCEARLPINVVGALACAENMPSGEATRPGDIVTAMNGKTVEILNTDAEGRLVLADTLCYVQRYQPRAIIDVATLTGACVIALGHVRSAVFSNDEDVLFALENASEETGDLIWHMPLDDAYQTQLDSPIADIQNIGGRAAGAITAACFLSRFIAEGQAWAHLDIAGTAWHSGKDKAGTGRPVPLFMQYLKSMAS